MQNLIKMYHAVQELRAFSLQDLGNPRHRFAYQWLDNDKINKYAKLDPNIP